MIEYRSEEQRQKVLEVRDEARAALDCYLGGTITGQGLLTQISQHKESINLIRSAGGVRGLPTVRIGDITYFVDERLCELRNILNPVDAIRFRDIWELKDYLILKVPGYVV